MRLLEILGIGEKPVVSMFKSVWEAAEYMSLQKSYKINWNEVQNDLKKSRWKPVIQLTDEGTTLGIDLLIQFYLRNFQNTPRSLELKVTAQHYFGYQPNKEEKPTVAQIMDFYDIIRNDETLYRFDRVVNKGCLKQLGPAWEKVFTANAIYFWYKQLSDVLKKWESEGAPIPQLSESTRKDAERLKVALSEWIKNGLYVPIEKGG